MRKLVDIPIKFKETSFFSKAIALYFLLVFCDTFTIGNTTLLKKYAIILVVLFLTQLHKISINVDEVFLLQLAYIFICGISVVYSINFDASLSMFISIAMNVGLVIICSIIPFSKKEIDLFRKSMVFGGLLILLIAVFYAEFSYGGRLTISIIGEGADENTLNGYIIYAFSYFVYNFILGKRRALAITMSMMCLIFVFLTGSRGALVAFLMVLIVSMIIGFINGGEQRRRALTILGGIAIFSCFYETIISFFPDKLAERYSLNYILLNGTTGRSDIWEALLTRLFNDKISVVLFGNGIGTSQYYNDINNLVAHNLFIEIIVGVGVLGLLVYLCLLYFIFKKALKNQQYIEFIALCGLITLSMTLSLVTYKPIFNMFFLIQVSSNLAKNQKNVNPIYLDDCLEK